MYYICWSFSVIVIVFANELDLFTLSFPVLSRLSKTRPLSLDLFRQNISMELAQAEPDHSRVRRCYEDALMEYGSTRPGQ